MALFLGRISTKIPRLTSLLTLTKILPQFYSKFDVDVMDEFTSQLMERKIEKWTEKSRLAKERIVIKEKDEPQDSVNLDNVTENQIDFLLKNHIENEDINSMIGLMKLCIKHSKLVSATVVIRVLSICAHNGNRNMIVAIQDYSQIHHPSLLIENSQFRHFLAQATWITGDINKALQLFEQVYCENPYLRRRIRLMLKYLISDLIQNGSGAALENMIGFCERILKDYQDYLPMTCIWQACFLSEWYVDQMVALNLLKKHNNLFKSVINRIPYVVFVSLKCHRTEVVYRLLEILLKYEMKQQYSSVLASLLDYQFQRGDLIRCAEIIRWALNNNVPLPQKQHIKMINLVINEKFNMPLAPIQEDVEEKPKCDFKF